MKDITAFSADELISRLWSLFQDDELTPLQLRDLQILGDDSDRKLQEADLDEEWD